MKKKFLIILFCIILMTTAIIAYMSTPRYMLNSYIKAYINKDFDKMYSLTKKYDEFTNKSNFILAAKEKHKNFKAYDLEIRENYALLSYDDKSIKLEYAKNPNGYIGINRYHITKGFIELIKDVTLYVPIDSTEVSLNGLDLKEYKVEYDNVIYDKYEIPYLYDCNYNINGIYDSIEYNDEINFSENREVTYEFKNDPIEIEVFTLNSCVYCTKLIEYFNVLKLDYKNIFEVKQLDYMNSSNEKLMKKYLKKYGLSQYYPLSIIGDTYIQGYSEDLENEYLFKIFDAYRKNID